jgi:hypothetical protein
MKSSTDTLLRHVLVDSGMSCGVSTERDWQTIRARVEYEGESFLTITLPTFEKSLTQALEEGKVTPAHFPGFKRIRRGEGLPALLRGFLELIFDHSTGILKDHPSVEAIQAIRQVCLLTSKIELPCTTRRLNDSYRQYVQTDAEVRLADKELGDYRASRFVAMCHVLWGDLFDVCERKLAFTGDLSFKHGPGATADDVFGNAKYVHLLWTERLEKEFPHWETGTLVPNERFLDRLNSVTILPPGAEQPSRVRSVPKTMKTPRIIALEPTHMQYVQQGLAAMFRQGFQADYNARNFVNYESNEFNQQLAWEGSVNGTLATLDLSEASDRVSNRHVELLFQRHTNLSRAVQACRSTKADVPGYGPTDRAKFASMGSALTFPIEALVFATIIFLGIERAVGYQLRQRDIKSLAGRVRVYGDDIIVPVDYVNFVISELEAFGLKVNVHKSFWTGKFRESCGAEFYDGEDVTVVRQRSPLPYSRTDAKELISTIELRNLLYWRGLWTAASYLDGVLEDLRVPMPIVESTSTLKGRASVFGYYPERWHPHLHSPLVKGMKVVAKPPQEPLEDYGALMKWFTSRGEKPTEVDLLSSSGRPRIVRLKTRWAQPY